MNLLICDYVEKRQDRFNGVHWPGPLRGGNVKVASPWVFVKVIEKNHLLFRIIDYRGSLARSSVKNITRLFYLIIIAFRQNVLLRDIIYVILLSTEDSIGLISVLL